MPKDVLHTLVVPAHVRRRAIELERGSSGSAEYLEGNSILTHPAAKSSPSWKSERRS